MSRASSRFSAALVTYLQQPNGTLELDVQDIRPRAAIAASCFAPLLIGQHNIMACDKGLSV